jgi:hypothetical protein
MVARRVIVRKKEPYFIMIYISANQNVAYLNRNFTEELAVWGKG